MNVYFATLKNDQRINFKSVDSTQPRHPLDSQLYPVVQGWLKGGEMGMGVEREKAGERESKRGIEEKRRREERGGKEKTKTLD